MHVPFDEADFRLRWQAEYRCEDGHYVRSKNEAIVDNWLYSHSICHAYEKAVFDQQTGATLSDLAAKLTLYDAAVKTYGENSQEAAQALSLLESTVQQTEAINNANLQMSSQAPRPLPPNSTFEIEV